MGTLHPQISTMKYIILAISTIHLLNAVSVPKTENPSCAAPDGTDVDWVYCNTDNAWYGVSKKPIYNHFSGEFQLCRFFSTTGSPRGHVAWMKEEEENTCGSQTLIETNTINEYVVLSGDYQEDDGGWVWPHNKPMTYFNWFPGTSSKMENKCMGAFYDGNTYGWLQNRCLRKSKVMC